jgi:cell division septum initiation protein DivIVA
MGDGIRDKASEVTGVAGEQGKEVAQHAASEASQLADSAKEQARQVKDEAAAQARGLVGQAKNELRDQSRSQADQAAKAIHRVGDQADALASGRVDEAGAVADYVRQAGERVHAVANRIDQRGVDGLLNDVQNFARRKPGAFLLGCAAAGFVAGRLIRGGTAESGNNDEGASNGSGQALQSPSVYAPPMA